MQPFKKTSVIFVIVPSSCLPHWACQGEKRLLVDLKNWQHSHVPDSSIEELLHAVVLSVSTAGTDLRVSVNPGIYNCP